MAGDLSGAKYDVTFKLAVQSHEENPQRFKGFQDAYQAAYDAIDQIAVISLDKRIRAENERLGELQRSSAAGFAGLVREMESAVRLNLDQLQREHDAFLSTVRGQFQLLAKSIPATTFSGQATDTGHSTTASSGFGVGVASPLQGADEVANSARQADISMQSAGQAAVKIVQSAQATREHFRRIMEDIGKIQDPDAMAQALQSAMSQHAADLTPSPTSGDALPRNVAASRQSGEGQSPRLYTAEPSPAQAESFAAGAKSAESSILAADAAAVQFNQHANDIRVTFRHLLDEIERMPDKMQGVKVISDVVSRATSEDPEALIPMAMELHNRASEAKLKHEIEQGVERQRLRESRAEATGLRPDMAGYSEFLAASDREQGAAIKARERMRQQYRDYADRQAEEEKRRKERESRAEATGLRPGMSGYDEFMGASDAEQERGLKARMRMRLEYRDFLAERAKEQQRIAAQVAADEERQRRASEADAKRSQRESEKLDRENQAREERARRETLRIADRAYREEERRRQQEAKDRAQSAAAEANTLAKREAQWAASEAEIFRTRESSAHRQMQLQHKLSNQLLGSAQGISHLVRSFALMGLAGEENSQKLLDGLLKVQAGFDFLVGAGRTIVHLQQAWTTYGQIVKTSADQQENEARAAALADEKARSLSGTLREETEAAKSAAEAHRQLADARTQAASAGSSLGAEGYTLGPSMMGGRRKSFAERAADWAGGPDDGLHPMQWEEWGRRFNPGAAPPPMSSRQDEINAYFEARGMRRPGLGGHLRGAARDVFGSLSARAVGDAVGAIDPTLGNYTAWGLESVLGRGAFGAAGTGLGAKFVGAASAAAVPAFIAAGIGAGAGASYDFSRAVGKYGYGGGADPGTYTAGMGNFYTNMAMKANRWTQGVGGLEGMLTLGIGSSQSDEHQLGRFGLGYFRQLNLIAQQEKAMEQQSKRMSQESEMAANRESQAQRDLHRRNVTRVMRRQFQDYDAQQSGVYYGMVEGHLRRRNDEATDDREIRLTSVLKDLAAANQQGSAQARGVEEQLAKIAQDRRMQAIDRPSLGLLSESRVNTESMRYSAIDAAESKDEYERLKFRRYGLGDTNVTMVELEAASKKSEEAEQRVLELKKQQFDIERRTKEEKLGAIQEAIRGYQQEIAIREDAARRERHRIETARERFGEMSPEEQRKAIEAKRRIDAERDLVAATGMSRSDREAAMASERQFAEVATQRQRIQSQVQAVEENRRVRASAPGQIKSLRDEIEQMRAGGESDADIREKEAQIESLKTAERRAFNAPERRVSDAELDAMRKSRDETYQRETELYQQSLANRNRANMSRAQAAADRDVISNTESAMKAGKEVSAEDRERYDQAYARQQRMIASGSSREDLRVARDVGLGEGEEMMRRRNQMDADAAGFGTTYGAGSRNSVENRNAEMETATSRQLTVKMEASKEMRVKVEADVEEMARQAANHIMPQVQAVMRAMQEAIEQSLAASMRSTTQDARGRAIGAGRS